MRKMVDFMSKYLGSFIVSLDILNLIKDSKGHVARAYLYII